MRTMVENDKDVVYLGCPGKMVSDIKMLNNKLNAEVVERVSDTQELLMLNNFARENNEYLYKKCLQERIAAISSWRWVLDDLSKRLQDGIAALRHEHDAISVVIDRIVDELKNQNQIKPGALGPMCDGVEQAILQENDYLKDQKKKFESLLRILDDEIATLNKTRRNIDSDILNKEQALNVEENCSKLSTPIASAKGTKKITKKKKSPVDLWEQRCISLKRTGLQALTNAIVIRQQVELPKLDCPLKQREVRGARVHLSITAQLYGARVDAVLRRRLHTNKLKLQDLYWQKEEAVRDYNTLEEELTATEKNMLETMNQERLIITRISDRNLRPTSELTTDEVERTMKDELSRLRNFITVLQENHSRITTLQNHLRDCIARVKNCITDILLVVQIDEDRIFHRLGVEPTPSPPAGGRVRASSPSRSPEETLEVIREEDEEDDYPFAY